MQTTLLGIAMAIILALLAALIGPAVIDWSLHRADLEGAATRLAGVPVRINGAIDIRLLPVPHLSVENIVIGAAEAPALRAASASVEFSIGPLLRGQWHATEIAILKPEFRAEQDAAGALRAEGLPGFAPALAVERLRIVDGRVTLARAAAPPLELRSLAFDGEVRALAASWRGEGAFAANGTDFTYRIAASRPDADAPLRLRLSVSRRDGLLDVDADGTLAWTADVPRFEGTLNAGRAAQLARDGADGLASPWKLLARLSATPQSALLDGIDFLRGTEETGQRFAGRAALSFGAALHAQLVLGTRALNLDRLAVERGATVASPGAVARALLAWLAEDAPALPVLDLSLAADEVQFGAGRLQSFGLEAQHSAAGWSVTRLDLRAPGQTQFVLSGKLNDAAAPSFTGAADLEAGDMRALLAWLEGRSAPAGPPTALRLRGDLQLGAEKLAIDRLRLEFDRDAVEGRLAWFWPQTDRASRFEAFVTAPRLDLDAARALAAALLPEGSPLLPEEWQVNAVAGTARLFGIEARGLAARLRLDRRALDIAQLSLADAEGVSLEAQGRLGLAEGEPPGAMSADLRAKNPAALARLIARAWPQSADMAALATLDGAVRLQAKIALLPGADAATPLMQRAVELDLQGGFGPLRGRLALGLAPPYPAFLETPRRALLSQARRLDAALEADDAAPFLKLTSLDAMLALPPRKPATLTASLARKDAEARASATLASGDALLSADATLDAKGDAPALALTLRNADVKPALGLAAPLPVSLAARGAFSQNTLALAALDGSAAGLAVNGALDVTFGTAARVSGTLRLAEADLPRLAAAALGLSRATAPDGTPRAEPFGAMPLRGLTGTIALETPKAALAPTLTAPLAATLQLADDGLALENLRASFAGGKQSGEIRLRQRDEARQLVFRLRAEDTDLAGLPEGFRALAESGRATVTLDGQSEGRSLAALIGALSGSGQFGFSALRLRGLSADAFRASTAFADAAPLIDAGQLQQVANAALARDALLMPQGEFPLILDAGLLRLSGGAMAGAGAALAPVLRLDLARMTLAGTLRLSGPLDPLVEGAPEIVVSLSGPASAPQRKTDTALLAAWLTLRAVEQQSRQLQTLPKDSQKAPAPMAPSGTAAESASPGSALPGSALPDSAPEIAAPAPIIREPDPAVPPLPPPVEIKPAPEPAALPRPRPAPPKRVVPALPRPVVREPLDLTPPASP